MSLQDLLNFTAFLNKFREVERVILVHGVDRDENDQEHSYSLAMLAWYIISTNKLSLDLTKVIQYALVHDLVEVYAGDTFFYSDDDTKQKREADAADKIKEEFASFTDLHQLIHAYESRADGESKFVYALDKIEPMLKIYLDGGRTWRRDGVTLAMLIEKKTDKVAVSKEIETYFNELIALLQTKEKELFLH